MAKDGWGYLTMPFKNIADKRAYQRRYYRDGYKLYKLQERKLDREAYKAAGLKWRMGPDGKRHWVTTA